MLLGEEGNRFSPRSLRTMFHLSFVASLLHPLAHPIHLENWRLEIVGDCPPSSTRATSSPHLSPLIRREWEEGQ